MAGRIIDRDNGYRARLKAIDAAGKGYVVTVGIQEEDEGLGYEGGMTLGEVAEANEFGTDTIPARPFLTGWADEREAAAVKEMAADIRGSIKAGQSPAARLDARAQVFAGEVQARIASGIPPENADATIARKGSSTPLVDTGQLRSAIRGKVEGK